MYSPINENLKAAFIATLAQSLNTHIKDALVLELAEIHAANAKAFIESPTIASLEGES